MINIKVAVNSFIYVLIRAIWGDAFANKRIPAKTILKCIFVQKVLRINGHVPWPVHWSSLVKCPEKIQHGTRCPGLSMNCYIDGRNGIIIGENVWVGPKVSLISQNHSLDNYNQYIEGPPIRISRDCLISTNAIVLPGVELGEHTVVGAGSVVTKSFTEGFQVIAGVPAKVIRKIAPPDGS